MKAPKVSILLALLPALAFAQVGGSESQQAAQSRVVSGVAIMAAFERAKECRLKSLFARQVIAFKERGDDISRPLSAAVGNEELTALVTQIYQPGIDNSGLENQIYDQCVNEQKRRMINR